MEQVTVCRRRRRLYQGKEGEMEGTAAVKEIEVARRRMQAGYVGRRRERL